MAKPRPLVLTDAEAAYVGELIPTVPGSNAVAALSMSEPLISSMIAWLTRRNARRLRDRLTKILEQPRKRVRKP